MSSLFSSTTPFRYDIDANHAVDAAGDQVEVVLLRRLVLADLDRVLEILLEEIRLCSGRSARRSPCP
jgi:hypothetical protein